MVLTCGEVQSQEGITGTVRQHENFASKFVAPRNLSVWLPPGYDKESSKWYPVVYMHDGQNLFDPKTSFIGVDWGVDEAMTKLIAEGAAPEAIIVGIWNSPARTPEYMPQKALAMMDTSSPAMAWIRQRFGGDAPLADKYLKFLTGEVKPFIDSVYRTLRDPANTSVMGSSMGGLVSLYAICEYPEVFGGAGCLSTHWPAGEGIVIDYLKTHLPGAAAHKIYFDFGTETLDKEYEPYQNKADAIMRAAGYTQGKNWITKKFAGDEHSERAWRNRVHLPLTFLLAK
ncbi:MAG: alpha/beta hydrolase, partial [Rhizobacter sp.]|nr:alpha/beta hydrolase [Chlorobiales bacterium]